MKVMLIRNRRHGTVHTISLSDNQMPEKVLGALNKAHEYRNYDPNPFYEIMSIVEA